MEKMFKVFSESHRCPQHPASKSSFSVETSPNVGNLFTNTCKEWREGTFENFKDWSVKQFGFEELESEDEKDVPADAQKAKDIVFARNKNGVLVFPEKTNFKLIRQKQRVVRGYIGAVYRQ